MRLAFGGTRQRRTRSARDHRSAASLIYAQIDAIVAHQQPPPNPYRQSLSEIAPAPVAGYKRSTGQLSRKQRWCASSASFSSRSAPKIRIVRKSVWLRFTTPLTTPTPAPSDLTTPVN